MVMEDFKTSFCAHNSHGHAKEFMQKLLTISLRALTKCC
jgi:hypothetical protein